MEIKKQIPLNVSLELHTEIKILSARRNISMTLWILRAIADRIREERKYDKPETTLDAIEWKVDDTKGD